MTQGNDHQGQRRYVLPLERDALLTDLAAERRRLNQEPELDVEQAYLDRACALGASEGEATAWVVTAPDGRVSFQGRLVRRPAEEPVSVTLPEFARALMGAGGQVKPTPGGGVRIDLPSTATEWVPVIRKAKAIVRERRPGHRALDPMLTPGLRRAPHARERRDAGARSHRQASARSSSRSGDSGDDDGPPEPPPWRGLCQLPECDLPARRKYCSRQHADVARQRRHREQAREQREQAGDTADRRRYLTLEADEFERLRSRVEAGCRCNGSHILDETGEGCVKCGHRRPGAYDAGCVRGVVC